MSYTGPAKLSDDSEKTIEEFTYGDILYYMPGKGLVSQETIYPVAICVRTRDESWTGTSVCTFMGLKYMCTISPEIGTSKPMGIIMGFETLTPQTAYQRMNQCKTPDKNWKNGTLLINNSDDWSMAWNCVWRYSPYCTERGQWFIPTLKDVKESIPARKSWRLILEAINKLRSQIGYTIIEMTDGYTKLMCSSGEKYDPFRSKVKMLRPTTNKNMIDIDSPIIPFIKVTGKIKN